MRHLSSQDPSWLGNGTVIVAVLFPLSRDHQDQPFSRRLRIQNEAYEHRMCLIYLASGVSFPRFMWANFFWSIATDCRTADTAAVWDDSAIAGLIAAGFFGFGLGLTFAWASGR